MPNPKPFRCATLLLGTLFFSGASFGLSSVPEEITVTAHLETGAQKTHAKDEQTSTPSAAIWLVPVHPSAAATEPATHGEYTLLQKDKQFHPHLLVVPIGSVVRFPNADPFFHNVFSLFNGKRFDLGLYEAGTSKNVTFSRGGVSYIFCNIHPEMSAVIISLSTPFYSVADERGVFHLHGVAPGTYTLHVWIEGASQSGLSALTRTVEVSESQTNLGSILAPAVSHEQKHANEFGQKYTEEDQSPY